MYKPVCWTEEQLRAELDRYENQLRDAGKARNTITTYVQHPERFINWLVGTYQPRPAATEPSVTKERGAQDMSRAPSRQSRYHPLNVYLAERTDPVVTMTFAEVERVIGGVLPASARRYRPWWGNEQSGTHVHAQAWMAAGRRTTNVDLNAATVDFVR